MKNSFLIIQDTTGALNGFDALGKKGRISFLPNNRIAVFVGHGSIHSIHTPFTLDENNLLSDQILLRKIQTHTGLKTLEFFYVESVKGYSMIL